MPHWETIRLCVSLHITATPQSLGQWIIRIFTSMTLKGDQHTRTTDSRICRPVSCGTVPPCRWCPYAEHAECVGVVEVKKGKGEENSKPCINALSHRFCAQGESSSGRRMIMQIRWLKGELLWSEMHEKNEKQTFRSIRPPSTIRFLGVFFDPFEMCLSC